MAIESIVSKTVAILGYGNQGRAHALNLRDCGVAVVVGARPGGRAWEKAKQDGFEPVVFEEAVRHSGVVMFLLPDQTIGPAFRDLARGLHQKYIGFAHGFAFHFGDLARLPGCQYFLVAPKGAGAMLRERFENGSGLPTAWAVAPGASPDTRDLAEAYARAIAGNTPFIRETTFQLETEGDLFGEQVVLVGGLMELMRGAFDTLVRNGHLPEMAFYDVCQEVQITVDLFLKYGPAAMLEKISRVAMYGAATRGPRIITQDTRRQMQVIFDEIRSGTFAKEWREEVSKGCPTIAQATQDTLESSWEDAFGLSRRLGPE